MNFNCMLSELCFRLPITLYFKQVQIGLNSKKNLKRLKWLEKLLCTVNVKLESSRFNKIPNAANGTFHNQNIMIRGYYPKSDSNANLKQITAQNSIYGLNIS